MFDRLFDSTSRILAKGLELRTLRQNFLASNVANAETPNYRPVDLDFQATMANLVSEMQRTQAPTPGASLEMARTDARHLEVGALDGGALTQQGGIVFAAGDDYGTGNDSNATSLEAEMGRLQMNSIQHAALTRILMQRVGEMRSIVDSSAKV